MNLLSWITSLLQKKNMVQLDESKTTNETTINKENQTDFDILISLRKDLQIDVSVFLDDSLINQNLMDTGYIYAKFIDDVCCDSLKTQIVDILTTQIKSKENASLIETIILFLDKISLSSNNSSPDKIFIKPSQVFSKYYDRI